MPHQIVLVDDHDVFRAGLRAIMLPDPDLRVVGEAADARTALAVVESTRPDVVLLDLSLPGSDGIAVARDILRGKNRPRVLVLTMHKGLDFVRQAFAVGVTGYALKSEPLESVIDAVHTVARGEVYLSPNLSRDSLAVDVRLGPGGTLERLSGREREIFSLIVSGHTSQKIAKELCISIKTVETHRSHINQKLGVHSTGEIVRLAAMRGMLAI